MVPAYERYVEPLGGGYINSIGTAKFMFGGDFGGKLAHAGVYVDQLHGRHAQYLLSYLVAELAVSGVPGNGACYLG